MSEFNEDNGATIQILLTVIEEQKEEIETLRRGIDTIKVRSYELGHRKIHDMALALLQSTERSGRSGFISLYTD